MAPKDNPMSKFREYIIILDCSGSMRGHYMDQAKQAALQFMKQLPIEDTYFNICKFGSTHELLREKSIPYNETNYEQAKAYIEAMDADMGGTEIRDMLWSLFQTELPSKSTKDRKFYKRQFVLLTDGGVLNTNECVELAASEFRRWNDGASNDCTYRIFTLGIGFGCSTDLISRLAKVTKAKALYIPTNGANMGATVLRMAMYCTRPSDPQFELKVSVPQFTLVRPNCEDLRVTPEAMRNVSDSKFTIFDFSKTEATRADYERCELEWVSFYVKFQAAKLRDSFLRIDNRISVLN